MEKPVSTALNHLLFPLILLNLILTLTTTIPPTLTTPQITTGTFVIYANPMGTTTGTMFVTRPCTANSWIYLSIVSLDI